MMPQTEVTYGRLDKVLRSFGFSRREFERHGKGVRYEHKDTGSLVTIPLYPDDEKVYLHHMVMVRSAIEDFGISDRSVLEKKLKRKTG